MADEKVAVLFLDDGTDENQIFLSEAFRLAFTVFTANQTEAGRAILKENRIHVLVIHQSERFPANIDLGEGLLEGYLKPVRIVLTHQQNEGNLKEAVQAGRIYHYLSAPWTEAVLTETINRASKIYEAKRRIKKMQEQLALSYKQLEWLLKNCS